MGMRSGSPHSDSGCESSRECCSETCLGIGSFSYCFARPERLSSTDSDTGLLTYIFAESSARNCDPGCQVLRPGNNWLNLG